MHRKLERGQRRDVSGNSNSSQGTKKAKKREREREEERKKWVPGINEGRKKEFG